MSLVFIYLGPTPPLSGCVLELLPRVTLATYATNGHFTVAWLLWAVELQWEYGE